MNKRAREIVDTFCTQIIKCETDIEDMWEMRTAVMNQLKSMRNCAKLELYVKIVKSLFNTKTNWIDFLTTQNSRSAIIAISWT